MNSGSWWWTGRLGVLQSMGSQRVEHDWVTKLKLKRVCHKEIVHEEEVKLAGFGNTRQQEAQNKEENHSVINGWWKWKDFSFTRANNIFMWEWFNSVTQSCPTLCNPMNHSTLGLLAHHQCLESTEPHIHWVGDAIQPSHPLSSPLPPALNLSQHHGLFKWVSYSHQVAKVLEFQLQHQSFQWTPRTDL